MEVTSIRDGVILDHLPAGSALRVLAYLRIDPARTRLALIMNVPSKQYGTKDIIKIEGVHEPDTTVLGVVTPHATINTVRDGTIVAKTHPQPPSHVTGVLTCKNPRCVTTVERGIEQMFYLGVSGMYRCEYCDEEATL